MLDNKHDEGGLFYTMEKLNRTLNGECSIVVDNKLPSYTGDMDTLYISKDARENFSDNEINSQLHVLRMYVGDAISALHDEDTKMLNKSLGVSRGILSRLGIKQKRLSIAWRYGSDELLESLDAHQKFCGKVETLYNEMIMSKNHTPLMKRSGKNRVIECGGEIAHKLMNHFHRTGLHIVQHGMYDKYNYPEE